MNYMNHAWLLLKFHQYWDRPQNSTTPTKMTTGLPAGQIRYPAPISYNPIRLRRCRQICYQNERTSKKKRALGTLSLYKYYGTYKLCESVPQRPQGFQIINPDILETFNFIIKNNHQIFTHGEISFQQHAVVEFLQAKPEV